VLAVLLLTVYALPIAASPSFTTSLSWYQGFDLTAAVKETAPNVVTIVFGSQGQVEIVPDLGAIQALVFTPETDFYIGFDTFSAQPVFVPLNITAMIVLDDTAFAAVGGTL
jgi:hypothetical protein